MRSRVKGRLIGVNRHNVRHLAIDSRVQRNLHNLPFHGKRSVSDGDGWIAVLEINPYCNWNEKKRHDEAKQEFFHSVRFPSKSDFNSILPNQLRTETVPNQFPAATPCGTPLRDDLIH